MSLVSVIVPCYNYGHFLRECVESILTQPGVDVRVLILDDDSTDNTPEIASTLAAEDLRVEYRRHQRNQGHIATYNEGLAWADGDYTLLISADDMLTPGALGRAASLMDAHPDVGFVYGPAIVFATGEPLPPARNPAGGCSQRVWSGLDWFAVVCKSGKNIVFSPEAVVRTRIQRELGGFRPELPNFGDMDMWLRLAVHADVGEILDADQAFYRIHRQNMHRNPRLLAGLHECKAAFDRMFEAYGDRIPNWQRLQNLAHRKLALEALGAASAAIDRREEATMPIKDLVEFALTTYRRIRRTPEYVGFRSRVLFGPTLWPFLRLVRDLVLPARLRQWAEARITGSVQKGRTV